jgi:hypothetical protein
MTKQPFVSSMADKRVKSVVESSQINTVFMVSFFDSAYLFNKNDKVAECAG